MIHIEKRIVYYTEWIKLLWIAFIASAGGTISLFFPPRTPIRDVFIILGFMGTLGVGLVILAIHNTIENMINYLEGEK